MIGSITQALENGAPLYVSELRELYHSASDTHDLTFVLELPAGERYRTGVLRVPGPESLREDERAVLVDYLQAEIYNLLTTLGGRKLTLYLGKRGEGLEPLVRRVAESFQVSRPRHERTGVGRVINVIERMMSALSETGSQDAPFSLRVVVDDPEDLPSDTRFETAPTQLLNQVTEGLGGRVFCGIDVGGTDIKAALVVNGELIGLKEYDWNPALLTNVEEIIDPIVDIVRLLGARAAVGTGRGDEQFESLYAEGLDKNISPARLTQIADELAEIASDVAVFDGIGISFPDVVIRDKVVGGEVPKTLGMRSNTTRDFEEQFQRLTNLDKTLSAFCTAGGVVRSTNDGPMAAFTAAVELSASDRASEVEHGVFAHSLGTDLGSGLVLADGSIPEIPLEVYNMIIDVGSSAARGFPAADVRSLLNTNTGVAGTMQRFTSQTGAFRVAFEYAAASKPALIDAASSEGYLSEVSDGNVRITIVPESPKDMRKGYLAYLMKQAETEPLIANVFRDIGEFLALTWIETERILGTGLRTRFLFGRLVKSSLCFELMQEGARRRVPELTLIAADSGMAYTPLMKQLDASEDFTVAQFGQAIGAVYFANTR